MEFFSKKEEQIYLETIEALPGKKNALDLKLIQAFAVEMATYEEACAKLAKSKVSRRGSGGEMPSPWIAIRNQAITNAQKITKLLNLSEHAKQEAPTAKVAKLDILQNGKKNPIQKVGS
jgi:phage terminase small subunit